MTKAHFVAPTEGRKRKRTSKFTICLAAMGKSAAVLSRRGHGCSISEQCHIVAGVQHHLKSAVGQVGAVGERCISPLTTWEVSAMVSTVSLVISL